MAESPYLAGKFSLAYRRLVAGVAKVHHKPEEVPECSPRRAQQGLHILQGAIKLAHHIAGMHDVAPGIDAGRAGEEDVLPILIGHGRAAFEGDAVENGGSQV